mmetsp:Transcript_3716/g.6535  ORF Transcript_3716/g.6535 Transcript_3716/m.6535 type:complete len:189 (-) Transcript_3716:239-805(-)
MIGLSYIFISSSIEAQNLSKEDIEELCSLDDEYCITTAKDGTEYKYMRPTINGLGYFLTVLGGFITGVAGVGVGEVVVPQLVQKSRVPVPVASGTSVLVVFLNALVAATVQVSGLVAASSSPAAAVPWELVVYTAPGVLIGGQIAPSLQGNFETRKLELAFGILFAIIGVSFGSITFDHYFSTGGMVQ